MVVQYCVTAKQTLFIFLMKIDKQSRFNGGSDIEKFFINLQLFPYLAAFVFYL